MFRIKKNHSVCAFYAFSFGYSGRNIYLCYDFCNILIINGYFRFFATCVQHLDSSGMNVPAVALSNVPHAAVEPVPVEGGVRRVAYSAQRVPGVAEYTVPG